MVYEAQERITRTADKVVKVVCVVNIFADESVLKKTYGVPNSIFRRMAQIADSRRCRRSGQPDEHER